MNRVYFLSAVFLFPGLVSAESPKPVVTAAPKPALRGAGAADLDDLMAKNPFPADAKGPLHLVPVAGGKVPGTAALYQVGGLHVRGEMTLHYHRRRSEIVYVISGTGTFTLGDEKIALKPGMVLHIPAKTPHAFKLDADGRVFFVTVGRFDPKDFVPFDAAKRAKVKEAVQKSGVLKVLGGGGSDARDAFGFGGLGVGSGKGRAAEKRAPKKMKRPAAADRDATDVVTPSTER